MDLREFRSFKHAEEIVTRFERILASYGIEINPGSELEAICAEIQDLEAKRAGRSPIPPGDTRLDMARAMGVLHLAEYVVAIHEQGRRLDIMVPHMRLLNSSVVAQNVRRIGDENANKLFELLLGLVCTGFATEIALDHPEHSKGDNPDIMFRYDGIKWALACKVPNGDSTISAFDNIKSAVEQIDRSNADRGIVVLNARNWINHDAVWKPPGGARIGLLEEKDIPWAWATKDMPAGLLKAESNKRRSAVFGDKGEELVEIFAASTKAAPVVLLFLSSATLIVNPLPPHGPVMARIGCLSVWEWADVTSHRSTVVDDQAIKLMTAINDGLLLLPQIDFLS